MTNSEDEETLPMNGVREHSEKYEVRLVRDTGYQGSGRWCIEAQNECGNNLTRVDFLDLVTWLESESGQLALTLARKGA